MRGGYVSFDIHSSKHETVKGNRIYIRECGGSNGRMLYEVVIGSLIHLAKHNTSQHF